jgi:hypothetical protein
MITLGNFRGAAGVCHEEKVCPPRKAYMCEMARAFFRTIFSFVGQKGENFIFLG